MSYFDMEKSAADAGMTADQLAALCRAMQREFPQDDMMYELHVVRACLAVKAGQVRLEEVLSEEAAVGSEKRR